MLSSDRVVRSGPDRGPADDWEVEPAMKIVVCVKYVPDAQADRRFAQPDLTTDRVGVDGLLSELDEYAVEAALRRGGVGGRVDRHRRSPWARSRRPTRSARSLQMGADAGVHVLDDALHGS